MIPQKRRYFTLIVHYGHKQPTDGLLEGLLKNTLLPDRIIVIDHGKEAYVPPLKSGLLKIIRPVDNAGYSGGLNIGLGALLAEEIGKNDIVVCMNNDAAVKSDFFSSLDKWWQKNPEPALMGVKQGFVNLLTGRARISSRPASGPRRNPFNIAYLHGSVLAAPYEVFMAVSGWPDKYFLYWEDVSISYLAAQKGFPLRTNRHLPYFHDDQAGQKYNLNQVYYLVRNGALFLERETPVFWRSWWYLVNRLRLFWHSRLFRRGDNTVANALADAVDGRYGKRKTSGENPPPAKSVSCGAVVVSYNSGESLSLCLESIKENNIQDIVVVDNASGDNSVSVARRHKARILRQPSNDGFAKAVNAGVAEMPGGLILLLNPDAVLCPGSVKKAVEFMRDNPETGVVGLLLTDDKGRAERNSFGPAVTPLSFLVRRLKKQPLPKETSETGWVSGGAMLIRREAFNRVGGFDDKFFMYWEDVDFCFRINKAGYKVAVMPRARAIHKRGASLEDTRLKAKVYDRSADRYFYKHYPKAVWLLHRQLKRCYRLFLRQAR